MFLRCSYVCTLSLKHVMDGSSTTGDLDWLGVQRSRSSLQVDFTQWLFGRSSLSLPDEYMFSQYLFPK